MKKGIIVISGYNMRAIISFLRVCVINEVPFYIIASGNDDPIFLTKYHSNVSYVRVDNDIERIYDIIMYVKFAEKLDEAFILPSTEYLNRYLLNNVNKFKAGNIKIKLINKELYEKISDKFSFSEMCENNGIKVPYIYKNYNDIKYPIIAKPKSYFDYIGKPKKISNKKDFENFLLNNDINNWFIQQYLIGSSYYLLYYFKEDGEYIAYSQQNLIQQKDGKSITLAMSSNIHELSISNEYANMLKNYKFQGLIMIELRKSNDIFYMIEANPRLWGPSQLFVDSKVPIFENYLYDMGFYIDSDKLKNTDYISSYYFWNEGLILSDGLETYYNYNNSNLLNNYNLLMNIEIFNREDTINLFNNKRVINNVN